MVRKARQSIEDRSLIIGVDRLDYSKGITQRIDAFERFVTDNPAHQRSVTYLQIAPPSRIQVPEYQEVRRELEGLAGHINGRHAKPVWTHIRYVNDSFPQSMLAGFHRTAAIGLITPLRDGMNLVAKEYVAAQNPDDPGVLILSRFAGAAMQLKDALLINPYSPEEMSDAIDRALAMPLDERKRRWRAMMDSVEQQDISWWRSAFTDRLAATRQEEPEAEPEPATE